MADRGDRRDFLASLAGGAWINAGIVDGPWADAPAAPLLVPAPSPATPDAAPQIWAAGRRVVFIDGGVAGAESLATEVQDGVIAVVLSESSNDLDQIVAWLAANGARDLATVALVSHGADGMVKIGSAWLTDATLEGYRDQLYTIGRALRPGGDIQLYACDVAQDAAGVAFVGRISSEAGGVAVAASSHLIGAAASGGSFVLDVNTGGSPSAVPFTAAAEQSFTGLLPVAQTQLFYSMGASGQPALAAEFSTISGTSLVSTTTLQFSALGTTTPTSPFAGKAASGIAIDPATGKYYLNNSSSTISNRILQGDIGSPLGTMTVIQNQGTTLAGTTVAFLINDLEFDQATQELYYTEFTGPTTNATLLGNIGVWKVGTAANATPAQVIGGNRAVALGGSLSSGFTNASSQFPKNLALDLADNLIFMADYIGASNTSTIWVGNVLTGGITPLRTSAAQFEMRNIAFSNGTLYWDIFNGATNANEGIFAAPVNIVNPGANATISLGTVSTLYAGSALLGTETAGLAVDASTGSIFWMNHPSQGSSINLLNRGTIAGSGVAAAVNVQTIAAPALNGATGGLLIDSLLVETIPTVTASGTVAYTASGTAVAVAPSAAVTNASGSFIAKGSVVISSGFLAGDTLTAVTSGTTITASYSSGTLTLTGVDTAAHYQSVIDSVKYSSTASDPRNGGANTTRALTYTVSDGLISSTSPTSTITVAAAPVAPSIVTAATISFTGGSGATPVLDSALKLTDADSANQVGATISVGNFVSGDVLNFTTQNGISSSYNSSTGTLVLSGTASVANYQAALRTISYSFSPSNGDPTAGNTKTSRTITWISNDGGLTSSAKTSVLNVLHAAPTVVATGTVSYGGGAGAVVLAPAATVTAPDSSGLLSSATIAITGGTFASDGDVLAATTTGTSINSSYTAGTYTLTLTGSDTVAHYQTVLRSVTIATSGKDPTNGGANPTRSISWTVNDGVLSSSAATTTATGTFCFLENTLIRTPGGEVAVENLKTGDRVITWSGEIRPIAWIGKGQVLATRGRRSAATPVIVRPGAIADGVPYKELRVTKCHAFWLDKVLIPVEFLVNHRSIRWDDHAQEVKLYHVELDRHDVLVANGAPAESYRDDGNRWLFQNANEGWDLPPLDHYAPVLTGGAAVDNVWRRLLDRAGPGRPVPMTDDPGLHVLSGGRRIAPTEVHGQTYVFDLPLLGTPVRLVSRSSVPAELGLVRDFRALGVPVAGIAAISDSRANVLEASDERFADGFHDHEAEGDIRWTDGDAELPAGLFLGCHGRTRVIVTLRGVTRYALLDEEEARAAA